MTTSTKSPGALSHRAPSRAWAVWCAAGAIALLGACQQSPQHEVTAQAAAPHIINHNTHASVIQDAPRVGQAKGKKVAAKADAKAGAKAEVKPYKRPEYPDNNRRNPFLPQMETLLPLVSIGGGSSIPGTPGANDKDPLERFTLGELELVAIISEVAVPKAMFVDPDGFGHTVKKGDKIGDQNGIVKDIRDNEVEIQETSGEDEGLSSKRTRVVRLRSTELRSDNSDDLSEAERKALERLMKTEKGQQILRNTLRGGQSPPSGGQAPPPARTGGGGVVPP